MQVGRETEGLGHRENQAAKHSERERHRGWPAGRQTVIESWRQAGGDTTRERGRQAERSGQAGRERERENRAGRDIQERRGAQADIQRETDRQVGEKDGAGRKTSSPCISLSLYLFSCLPDIFYRPVSLYFPAFVSLYLSA